MFKRKCKCGKIIEHITEKSRRWAKINNRGCYWCRPPAHKDKYHTNDTKKRISLAKQGTTLSIEHKKKISLALKGKNRPKSVGRKISLTLKGKRFSDEHRQKLSESHRGNPGYWKGKHRCFSNETKRKMRESALNKICPRYNENACNLIDEYGKRNGYSFQHALNGGEVRVIGYSLDGYDAKKNVVIEYYENAHKKRWRDDLIRQRRIMKHLGCKFIVLKEWES